MASPLRISSAFLSTIKALYPPSSSQTTRSPWYIVAAVAFTASNRPEGVRRVFEDALEDLRSESATKSEEFLLAQKMREALFRSGLISGYNKAINGLKALHEVMPEDLQEKKLQRDTALPLPAVEAYGRELFEHLYGETSDTVQGLLDAAYPDMGWFSRTIGYGLVYGGNNILSPMETSYALVAALIAGDTPLQIGWHMSNARRVGASLEEAQAVRQTSIDVAKFCGVRWIHSIPEVA